MSHPDHNTSAFKGAAITAYVEGPPKKVPGFAGLHRMMNLMLAETMPADGQVLVLGAGGGLEIRAMADAQPHWSFTGVDPSADMLTIAETTIGPHGARVWLINGYIDAAPQGPFDGATCLLTLHFIPRDQRLETLRALHQRLKPGAPFVAAHISFPQEEPERTLWVARHVAFGGADPAHAAAERAAIGTRLPILSPEDDADLLRQAGFQNVALFYAAFSFRGWIAYA